MTSAIESATDEVKRAALSACADTCTAVQPTPAPAPQPVPAAQPKKAQKAKKREGASLEKYRALSQEEITKKNVELIARIKSTLQRDHAKEFQTKFDEFKQSSSKYRLDQISAMDYFRNYHSIFTGAGERVHVCAHVCFGLN